MIALRILMCLLVAAYPCFAAWSSVGSFASTSHRVSSDPQAFTTSATLEAGNVGICAFGVDNDGNGTEGDIVSITDDAGNTWVSAGENEIDPGAANAGAYVAIYYTHATTQLTSGSNITVDLGAARVAKALSCWEFTIGAGKTVATVGAEQEVDNTNADAGNLTISSLENSEHLFVRAIASETTNGAIGTQTSSFSVFTSSVASSGTEASSMGVAAEFRIYTGTSLASDPTMSDTTADRASTYVAFDEVSSRRRSMVVQ